MTQRVDLSNIPDDLKELVQFARDWWDDETRRLPGEERLNNVFVIEYYDGCKYFGYTKEYVAYRVATLSADVGGEGPHPLHRAARPHRPLRGPVHRIKPRRPRRQGTPRHHGSPGA